MVEEDDIDKIYGQYINIDYLKHLEWLVKNQNKWMSNEITVGGWLEVPSRSQHASPQSTAQVIIPLTKFCKDAEINKAYDLHATITRGVNYLKESQNEMDGGWPDHSNSISIVDATGASLVALSVAADLYSQEYVRVEATRGVEFLIKEQNTDGGWGIRKNANSKIQYSYWAILGLINTNLHFNIQADSAIDDGIKWLINNFRLHDWKGCSIKYESDDDINPIATAMALELILIRNLSTLGADKIQSILDILENEFEAYSWSPETDFETFREIPRRGYSLSDFARVIDALLLLNVKIHTRLFQNVIASIVNLEDQRGGFSFKTHETPVTWNTAQILNSLLLTRNNIRDNISGYQQIINPQESDSVRNKTALMVGRFQPPHIGHINGIKATVNFNPSQFIKGKKAFDDLSKCKNIILGIARTEENEDNPWTSGERSSIWRKIIEEDEELKHHKERISIVTTPAERSRINILSSVLEHTTNKEDIIVLSGNDRVINQCEENDINYLRFKRNDVSGTSIRELVRKLTFNFQETDQAIEEQLQELLHPIVYQYMKEKNLFKKGNKIMMAK